MRSEFCTFSHKFDKYLIDFHLIHPIHLIHHFNFNHHFLDLAEIFIDGH
jgi:hypothetical protein